MSFQCLFKNGVFGDPAFLLSEEGGSADLLFDCGDLSRFLPRQLLKVQRIFLSHCHMDHLFGFDFFLRVHMGVDKEVQIFGPPETAHRIAGKLQGYTWNLIRDRNLCFRVFELDETHSQKKTVEFHSKNGFERVGCGDQPWTPSQGVFELTERDRTQVFARTLDHRTPSLSYALVERPSFSIRSGELGTLGLQAGPWIGELKELLFKAWFELEQKGGVRGDRLEERDLFEHLKGEVHGQSAASLAVKTMVLHPGSKWVYTTDGAASQENQAQIEALLALKQPTDHFLAETCFVERDRRLADETKHFTAEFMSKIAQLNGVKQLLPFHFSKRYGSGPDEVYGELSTHFSRDIHRFSSPSLDNS